MDPEAPSVDQILEGIDAEMSSSKQPKVLMFDIGGVCVKSPFQAILDYELSLGIPPGWVNYSISRSAPNGYWQRVERGEIAMDTDFFNGFNKDLHVQARWENFYKREQTKNADLAEEIPPLPTVDGEWLFNEMMSASNHPDPWMQPALQSLRTSGKYILAALSNTVIFPPGHKLHVEDFFNNPLRRLFDVFISSAHVGIRKPDPRMYQLALKTLDKYAREHAHSNQGKGWEAGILPQEVVFLDDIGENLKEARNQGFRTIKVPLGRTYEAVEELEEITGLELEGSHPKIPVRPRLPASRAKI